MLDLDNLAKTVQFNCHLSDAAHAADYTLCVYLLKMREYFRWERGLELTAPLPGDEVGRWLREREMFWEEIEDRSFASLEIDGEIFEPFDVSGINRVLLPRGFVYSAGYGRGGAAHFVLAELERCEPAGRGDVYWLGKELARDLSAPPAMSLGDDIYIRRESFRRMVWEKVQESDWTRCDTPMKRAMRCFELDKGLESGVRRLADAQLELLLRHERGEQQAGVILGDAWEQCLLPFLGTPMELHFRAVRDWLADCLVTLPELVAEEREEDIHFYLSTLTPNRKALFPALVNAYETWLLGGGIGLLEQEAARGRGHWERVARDLLHLQPPTDEENAQLAERLVAESVL